MGSRYQETIGWYNRNAEQYAEETQIDSKIDKEQLERFAALLPKGARVLDAGCGAGRDANQFKIKGFDVVGADISPGLLVYARKRYPGVVFQEEDMLRLSFPDASFDGVWAHASFVHFEDDRQITTALAEIRRVLVPGGILHMLVKVKKEEEADNAKNITSGTERFFRHYTPEELKTLFKDSGIAIFEMLQYRESDIDPQKRPGEDIEWILVHARKR